MRAVYLALGILKLNIALTVLALMFSFKTMCFGSHPFAVVRLLFTLRLIRVSLAKDFVLHKNKLNLLFFKNHIVCVTVRKISI